MAKDYAQAAKWFQRSSDHGNSSGQQALAWLHRNGWGVKQDDAAAARLFRAAAEQGNPYAAQGLGYCLRTGRGVTKDFAQARKWFLAGVERGDRAYSAVSLGAMYENGEGVTQDYIEAYKWHLIAAANEAPEAQKLAAAEGDQATGTIEAEGHGLFIYYFLEGLGEGRKTSRGLCDYLKPKVSDAAALENRTRTPSCRDADLTF